jgi:hypothetical protein
MQIERGQLLERAGRDTHHAEALPVQY